MQDIVGPHSHTAIRQLESGRAGPGEALQTLRYSLIQLKLSIHVMNLPPDDITGLLANMRYRLQLRFLASTIEFQWDVHLLELVLQLDGNAVRHL